MRILSAAAAAVAALSLAVPAAGAQADTLGQVTVHVQHRADNGHGQPATWAHDTFTRTATIRTGTAEGSYQVELAGKGTFTTVKGGGEPSGSGATVKRRVTGDFAESLVATVTGGTPRSKRALGNLDGDTFGGKTTRANAQAFIGKLFKGDVQVHTAAYTYVYETRTADGANICERWVDSSGNNDGQADDAGTFIGRNCDAGAPLVTAKAKCRMSKTDKRETWTITAGPRAVRVWAWVYYPGATGAHVKNGWLHLPNGSGAYDLAANQVKEITSPYGGGLAVHARVLRKDGSYGKAPEAKVWTTSNHKVTCK